MKLKIKKLRDKAVIPSRQTAGSAGYDLYACIDGDITLKSGQIRGIATGISAEISRDSALMIYPRSGIAAKHGISLANCVGVVDSDYRGEIIVPLINHGTEDFTVTDGMRIAQLVVTPVLLPEIEEAEELTGTERGGGGFGSTGW